MTLSRMDLVILDELGCLPFSQAGGTLLFHLRFKFYEHAGITSNFNAWPVFRIGYNLPSTHNSRQKKGTSTRKDHSFPCIGPTVVVGAEHAGPKGLDHPR